MKAIFYEEPGSLDVLKYQEVADPVPDKGDVIVDVAATSLNRLDVLQRNGWFQMPGFTYPHISGMDLAGTVAEIGSEVRSGIMALEDAEASKDEAKALEDERAGVSLDEEAAALIQFQQAFSANARIIQTARELFDSLMRVVSR